MSPSRGVGDNCALEWVTKSIYSFISEIEKYEYILENGYRHYYRNSKYKSFLEFDDFKKNQFFQSICRKIINFKLKYQVLNMIWFALNCHLKLKRFFCHWFISRIIVLLHGGVRQGLLHGHPGQGVEGEQFAQ